MLSGATVQDGLLAVQATESVPHRINITLGATRRVLRVQVDRLVQIVPASQVHAIEIQGGPLADVIRIGSGILTPAAISGGGGNDRIIAGGEDDTIVTGPGRSLIWPGAGHNQVNATLGSNSIYVSLFASDTIIATNADTIFHRTPRTRVISPAVPLPPVPVPAPVPYSPPVLQPGAGFPAPTAQPPATGSGFAADAMAIAHWDVVPYQTFSGRFEVGVVAFHINGIARVDFSVNGGPWSSVTRLYINPQTGVNEYVATLDTATFLQGGPIEVRAIAYPTAGVPRVLESLPLNVSIDNPPASIARYVSPAGSDSTGDGSVDHPFATLMQAEFAIGQASGTHTADGGTIYLEPGNYNFGTRQWWLDTTTSTAWLTITPAPGVPRTSVALVSGTPDGIRTGLVHIDNLMITPGPGQTVLLSPVINASLWIDHCVLSGQGRTVDMEWTNGFSHIYATDSDVSNSRDGLVGADLARNVSVHDIGSDAFSDTSTILKCRAANIDASGTTFHPDVVQYYGRSDNLIVYGLTATQGIAAEGLFVRTANPAASNIAWVQCNIDNSVLAPTALAFQVITPTQNLFVDDSSFVGRALFRPDMGFTATDVVLRADSFAGGPEAPGIVSGVLYEP